jgi:Rer1 family
MNFSPNHAGPYRIDPTRDSFRPSPSSSSDTTLFGKMQQSVDMLARGLKNTIDRSHAFPLYRWLLNAILLILFMLRVFYVQGFYVVAYTLGIYGLSSFLLFLSPKIDPALSLDNDADLNDLDEDCQEAGPALPLSANDEEFRPFIRRLPEFVFW